MRCYCVISFVNCSQTLVSSETYVCLWFRGAMVCIISFSQSSLSKSDIEGKFKVFQVNLPLPFSQKIYPLFLRTRFDPPVSPLVVVDQNVRAFSDPDVGHTSLTFPVSQTVLSFLPGVV